MGVGISQELCDEGLLRYHYLFGRMYTQKREEVTYSTVRCEKREFRYHASVDVKAPPSQLTNKKVA